MTGYVLAAALLSFAAQTPAAQAPVRPGNGVTSPRLLKTVAPTHPEPTVNPAFRGAVTLEAIVGVEGIPTAIRVTQSLRPSYDAAAVEAASQWRFAPGLDASGKPVPVIITLILEFGPQSQSGLLEDPEFATAFSPGNGITNPTLIRQAEPRYTADAMRAKIEGVVELDVVVRADGTVGATKVVKSLDRQFGSDNEAIKAAKLWLFKPGTDRAGTPVPVRVRLILEFRY
jgi:protein TonB